MRLIDADKLEPDADYDDGEFWAYSITQIENAPTIEPKMGKWISKADQRWHCSLCDGIAPKGYRWNYCPNCGARMEGGEQE